MKIYFLLLCLFVLSLIGCQEDNPYQGNWSFMFFGCYDYDIQIADNGNFEFNAPLPLRNSDTISYTVKGNINEDGEVTGNILLSGSNVGLLTGLSNIDTTMYGNYQIEWNESLLFCSLTNDNGNVWHSHRVD